MTKNWKERPHAISRISGRHHLPMDDTEFAFMSADVLKRAKAGGDSGCVYLAPAKWGAQLWAFKYKGRWLPMVLALNHRIIITVLPTRKLAGYLHKLPIGEKA